MTTSSPSSNIPLPHALNIYTFHITLITKGPPAHGLFSRVTSPCSHLSIDGLDFAFQGLSALEIRDYGTWRIVFNLKETLDKSSLQWLVLHVMPKNVMQQIFTSVPKSIRDLQILLAGLRAIEVYTSEWLTSGFLPSSICSPAQSSKTCSCARPSTGSLIEVPGRTILHHSKIPSTRSSLGHDHHLYPHLFPIVCSCAQPTFNSYPMRFLLRQLQP